MAEIKRLNYFTSQFLVEQDFKDEQAYHVAMRRRHNQVLHSWGIAHDLVVTRSADKVVSVSPGTAIDKDGREIVLLDATPVTLSTPGPGDVYVTIAYHEISEEADLYQSGVIHNYTRTTEAPGLEIVTTPPPGDGSVVVLAKIHLDGSGNVDTLDPSVRRNAGSAVPAETDLTVNSLVTNTATAHGDVDIGGAAHLSGPLGVGGDITVSGTVNGRQVATDGTNLDAHLAIVNGNPHGTTAAQVGALGSVDGVTNPGGNVDLIAANAITIAPNDANNTITIGESHSSLTGNPHATTAAQVGALPLAGGTVSGNLIVSGAGNFGIGTAVPGFRFHQLGGDHVVEDANISLRRAGMHRWTMQAQAGTGLRIVQAYSDSGNLLNASRLQIDDAGNVGIGATLGIGTVAPGAALDVRGQARASTLAITDPSGAVYPDNAIAMANNIDAATKWLQIGGITDAGARRLALLADRTFISGSLGIGTAQPDRSLTVANALGANYLNVKDGTREILVGVDGTAGGVGILSVVSNHDLVLRAGANNEKLRITAGGNVGIGTTAPSAKLTVNSNIAGLGPGAPGILVGNPSGTAALWLGKDSNDYLEVSWLDPTHGRIFVGGGKPLALQEFGGNVGIGTPSPGYTFHQVGGDHVIEGADISLRRAGMHRWRIQELATTGFRVFQVYNDAGLLVNASRLSIADGGNVGIGTDSPADRLDVSGELRILSGSNAIRFTAAWSSFGDGTNRAEISNDTGTYKTLMIVGNGSAGLGRRVSIWDRLEVNGETALTGRLGVFGQPSAPRTAGWAGGIHTFDLEAEGTVWSRNGYQSGPRDIAENYESETDLEAGDVVCLDIRKKNRIVRSESPNDPLVLGVVSTAPGFLLHVDPDGKHQDAKHFPVALCGRVPCNVTDEGGPIERGDLLTSSSTPGHAMKAERIPIGGAGGSYRPGTIIGKALAPLESGNGVIEIFVLFM